MAKQTDNFHLKRQYHKPGKSVTEMQMLSFMRAHTESLKNNLSEVDGEHEVKFLRALAFMQWMKPINSGKWLSVC